MAKGWPRLVLVVTTNSKDPAREKEFSEWYNRVHLPDVLGVEGFVAAARYENTHHRPGEPRFLALYEIKTRDVKATMKALAARAPEWRAKGHLHDCLEVVLANTFELIPGSVQTRKK